MKTFNSGKGTVFNALRLLLGLIALLFVIGIASAQELTLHFISVGHGDAIFIEYPDGTSMLVDGGKPDLGKRVYDYLDDMGYSKIDYVVLTHNHDDHIGGLLRVMRELDVGEVWECPYHDLTPAYTEFEKIIGEKSIPARQICRGDTFQFGEVIGEVFNPPLGSSLEELSGLNGASVVMRLQYGYTSVLLAGDIDQETDRKLAEKFGEKLQSTMLKCPHHASAFSNSAEFLQAVSPEIAVVSAGPSEYGYPAAKTMERIAKFVPKVYRTDVEGDIIISLDGERAEVITQ